MFWLYVLGAAMFGFCLGVMVAGWAGAHHPYVDRSPL